MMRKKFLGLWLVLCCLLLAVPASAAFSETRTNDETGYEMAIEDRAGILNESSGTITSVWEQLETISGYGSAAVLTVSENDESASELAEEVYHDRYGSGSGVLCLIDMDNREIYIFSDGKVHKTITRSVALTITDNSYEYASDGDYDRCVLEMTEEIAGKLEGSSIAQPMRYLCAALLAILVGLLLTYILAKKMNSTALSGEQEIIGSISRKQSLSHSRFDLVERKISLKSSGGSGGSGGGGGGGSSGGGGGHGF